MTNLYYAIVGGLIVFLAWHIWFGIILPRRPRHEPLQTPAPLHKYNPGDYVVFTRDSVGMIMPNGTLYVAGMTGTVLTATDAWCSIETEDGRIVLAPSYHVRMCRGGAA